MQSLDVSAANLQHLDNFVLRTLQQLIAQETTQFGRTTLSVFARLDVGFILNQEQEEYQYFVNEVERLPGGCFWVMNPNTPELAGGSTTGSTPESLPSTTSPSSAASLAAGSASFPAQGCRAQLVADSLSRSISTYDYSSLFSHVSQSWWSFE